MGDVDSGVNRAPAWHSMDIETVAAEVGTGRQGLAVAEARARLERHGKNVIETVPPPGRVEVLLNQFRSPVIYILVIAALVTLVLEEFIDAGVIAAVLILNAAIGYSQERRAEESVRALMHLVPPLARVVREGREWEVDSRDLVVGDVVLLESGARVPADLRMESVNSLLVDESLLTGESVAVEKHSSTLGNPDLLVSDRQNMAHAGSLTTSGRGRGFVVATGMGTELGKIAAQMRYQKVPETPLQRRMAEFARVVGMIVALAAAAGFVLGVLLGESASHMFLVAVALAVAAVPEGLPVAFTITLALGVRRMARRNAIIRSLPAVETLGSTTVIGSDKTGTLTENRMTVREIWAGGARFSVEGNAIQEAGNKSGGSPALAEHRPLYLTVLAGVLSNEAEIYRRDEELEAHGDPTETALLVAATRLGIEPEEVRHGYPAEFDVPFESARQYSASVRHDGHRRLIFAKGAPERIIAMSASQLMDDGEADINAATALEAARAMGERGLRVLAMGYREVEDGYNPGDLTGLVFLGLQGLLDPPRAGVREAIAGCREAGIRVVMITGDHAVTAAAIAREVGIGKEGSAVLTGTEIEQLDQRQLEERVEHTDVYARAAPEHKLRIVDALRQRGEVVAVTGDGVNDAPALRAADIGIAMGKGGTDVAREAADMVLADDNFVSIYAAVEEGRVTFENVRKVTFFLVSTGAASIIAILSSVVLGWPVPMVAAQLLWLNLVTNGLQDVALAFEPGERGVLGRPPRRRTEGIISRLLWERTVIAGTVMAAGTLLLFRWELDESGSVDQARTVALTTMVLFQMMHVGNSRSERLSVFAKSPFSNHFLIIATAAALVVHIAALYLPPTQYILRVEPLEMAAWIRMLVVAVSIILVIEVHKALRGDPSARS